MCQAGHAFWERIVAAKATLIASTEVGDSDVSAASADQFLREDAPVFVPPPAAPAAPEEKDLVRGTAWHIPSTRANARASLADCALFTCARFSSPSWSRFNTVLSCGRCTEGG